VYPCYFNYFTIESVHSQVSGKTERTFSTVFIPEAELGAMGAIGFGIAPPAIAIIGPPLIIPGKG
jgi:hypothetical protein